MRALNGDTPFPLVRRSAVVDNVKVELALQWRTDDDIQIISVANGTVTRTDSRERVGVYAAVLDVLDPPGPPEMVEDKKDAFVEAVHALECPMEYHRRDHPEVDAMCRRLEHTVRGLTVVCSTWLFAPDFSNETGTKLSNRSVFPIARALTRDAIAECLRAYPELATRVQVQPDH